MWWLSQSKRSIRYKAIYNVLAKINGCMLGRPCEDDNRASLDQDFLGGDGLWKVMALLASKVGRETIGVDILRPRLQLRVTLYIFIRLY